MISEAVLALKTALVAAARDPALRSRAVSALRGAELWAAAWASDAGLLRTLTSSSGLTALPLFSDEQELHEAAVRYAWLGVSGDTPQRKMALWEAIRVAKQQGAQLIIVDLGSEHALELDEGDFELLSSPPTNRPPAPVQVRTAPTEGAAVRRASSRPPPSEDGDQGEYSPLRPRSVTPDAHGVSATFGATSTATMQALPGTPQEDLLDAFSELLREYPEVEWACLVTSVRKDHPDAPSLALRVDPAFRKNLSEITRKLHELSMRMGARHDVLVLETPEQMKQARHVGVPFYPWRKK